MNQTALALFVGLLAGVAGGFLPRILVPGPEAPVPVVAPADADLAARLDRIEARLEALGGGPLTTGPTGGALTGSAPRRVVVGLDAEALEELKQVTKKTVQETLAEAREAEGATKTTPGRGGRRGKKRVKLADAAVELGLSGAEEDDLRRIYDETYEKALKLLAGENGDPEEVRRDVEAARNEPGKRFQVLGKYMPRIVPKIGDFLALEAARQKRIEQAVGKDKAREMNRKYDIEEANPLGFGGSMRFEADVDGTGTPGAGR